MLLQLLGAYAEYVGIDQKGIERILNSDEREEFNLIINNKVCTLCFVDFGGKKFINAVISLDRINLSDDLKAHCDSICDTLRIESKANICLYANEVNRIVALTAFISKEECTKSKFINFMLSMQYMLDQVTEQKLKVVDWRFVEDEEQDEQLDINLCLQNAHLDKERIEKSRNCIVSEGVVTQIHYNELNHSIKLTSLVANNSFNVPYLKILESNLNLSSSSFATQGEALYFEHYIDEKSLQANHLAKRLDVHMKGVRLFKRDYMKFLCITNQNSPNNSQFIRQARSRMSV